MVFGCIGAFPLGLLAALIALLLGQGRSINDINDLGNFLVGVGSILLVIAAHAQTLEEAAAPQPQKQPAAEPELQEEIRRLEEQIGLLQRRINGESA